MDKINKINIVSNAFFWKLCCIISFYFAINSTSLLGQSKDMQLQSVSDYRCYSSFYVCSKLSEKTHYDPNKEYYWYKDNEIHITKGGVSGNPLNGSFVSYYLNNNLKEKGSFSEGLKNNEWREWFQNGVLHKIENFNKGLLEGQYKLYSIDGLLMIAGNYKNNQKDGDWYEYDNKGNVVNHYTYKKGILEGKFSLYSQDGIKKGNYHNNLLNGKFYYISNGKTDSVKTYKNGIEIIKTIQPKKQKQEKKKQVKKSDKPSYSQNAADTASTKVKKRGFLGIFSSKKSEKVKSPQKPSVQNKAITQPQDTTVKKKSFFNIFRKKTKSSKKEEKQKEQK